MKVSIMWFRRDLRLNDNSALYHALRSGNPVLPIFIFDKNILDDLEDEDDARVNFIHNVLIDMKVSIVKAGSDLKVYYGDPLDVLKKVIKDYEVVELYTNRDYESYAIQRDAAVRSFLQTEGIAMHTFKDQVIFEKDEVLKDNGEPYVVFTPYKKKWLEKLNSRTENGRSYYVKPYPTHTLYDHFAKIDEPEELITLGEMGFVHSSIKIPAPTVAKNLIKTYGENRNFPAMAGTSRLGIHFRFGTISIREKVSSALDLSDVYLNELIWRDFYSSILQAHPHVEKGNFRPAYDRIDWRNNEKEFEAWCEGKTGYPIVDAGMRELNATGFMHNRVRMIAASFLTKHLLIDWRWGEAYFARKLLDFELASNNGGWQWAAGTGTDAAPYFRIFNPTSQQKKFDPSNRYVKNWVPEWGTEEYPGPIVDHKEARERCLAAYKKALS